MLPHRVATTVLTTTTTTVTHLHRMPNIRVATGFALTSARAHAYGSEG